MNHLQEVLERINSDVANVAIIAATKEAFGPNLKKGNIWVKSSFCRLISLGFVLDLNDYHLVNPSLEPAVASEILRDGKPFSEIW